MKKAILFAVVCAFATPALADDAADAKATEEAWAKAFNDGDAKALGELYADNAVMVGPGAGQEFKGKKEIEAHFNEMFKGKKGGGDMKVSEVTVLPVGDGLAVFSRWSGSMPTPDGKKREVRLRSTAVLIKLGGKYKYLMDHASSPLPGKMETHAPKK